MFEDCNEEYVVLLLLHVSFASFVITDFEYSLELKIFLIFDLNSNLNARFDSRDSIRTQTADSHGRTE